MSYQALWASADNYKIENSFKTYYAKIVPLYPDTQASMIRFPTVLKTDSCNYNNTLQVNLQMFHIKLHHYFKTLTNPNFHNSFPII